MSNENNIADKSGCMPSSSPVINQFRVPVTDMLKLNISANFFDTYLSIFSVFDESWIKIQ
jgi:hypothetical protein